jgi:type VI secretion system protein ImpG
MRDKFESLYERELFAIRQLAGEFARERPKIADRLLIAQDTGESIDPHVERLIQAFAFLTARVRLKIEDEFPELTDALLGVLYPHYLAPIPSMGIAEFAIDPQRGPSEAGYLLPRHTSLSSRPVGGVRCRFRTAYPVQLWPLTIPAARYVTAPFPAEFGLPRSLRDQVSALAISLRTRSELPFAALQANGAKSLRFHLAGDGRTVGQLYELIFNHAAKVVLHAPATGRQAVLSPEAALSVVGFDREEGLLPYPPQSFQGYRLLTEYFAFPRKFHFVDVHGFDAGALAEAGDRVELFILFRDLPDPGLDGLASRVRADSFRLGCTPVVNLFNQVADPIRLTHEKSEYRVVPDVRAPDAHEVYSIESVEGTDLTSERVVRYEPYYACRHGAAPEAQPAYWHARRERSPRAGDSGTDVYISLVDLAFEPIRAGNEVLTLHTTCTNRNIPTELRAAGAEAWGLQVDGQAPVISPIMLVVPPTASTRPPGDEARWRLISHLSLNHLSITSGLDGADALREMLKLYDLTGSAVTARQIAGLTDVTSRRTTARVAQGLASAFCRGVEIDVAFDPQQYTGTGVFLFATVLERFLPLYASINSFTRLVARYRGAAQPFRRWPCRVGEQSPL